MKKVTLFLLLLCFSISVSAQVLNQPAAWPNTDWTVTGTYNIDPTAFEADPTLTSNFAFDDDDAGGSSDDDIAAESPVVDLSSAFSAGETWLFINVDYTYNDLGDVLNLEYWDADSSAWTTWQQFGPSANQPTNDFCNGDRDSFTSNQLNIAGFTATQQTGFRYRIAFYDDGPGGGAGWEWGFCFDAPTLSSQSPPSCPDPEALSVSNEASNSADLAWTESGVASLWNVEIVLSGDAPTGTPTATGVSNPYTATGLAAITSFDFYVQADCGAGGTSNFVGPFTFTTLCDVFVPDYIEDFTTIVPNCWDEADSGDATSGPGDLGGGSWVADEYLNIGTGDGAYKINLFAASKSDWIISPLFDLTGGPFQVEFDFAITNWNSSTVAGTLGSDDLVQLLMTNDGGTTWIPLITYDNTSVVPITGLHPVVDLTAYSGQTVQFGILGSEGIVNDAEDIDVFVDNFQVRNVPTCAEPTDVAITNITSDGGELSWTENGTSTIWNVEIVPAGDTPTGAPTATNVSNPYIATAYMQLLS